MKWVGSWTRGGPRKIFQDFFLVCDSGLVPCFTVFRGFLGSKVGNYFELFLIKSVNPY